MTETKKDFVEQVRIGPDRTVNVRMRYVTTDAEIDELMEWVRPLKHVLVDTETGGLDPKDSDIATLQIGHPAPPNGEGRVYVICMRSVSKAALEPVRQLMADPKVCKIGQNIGFEIRFLGVRRRWKFRNVADTQVVELLLRAGLFESSRRKSGAKKSSDEGSRAAYGETSMGKLAERYLGIRIDKDRYLRTSFWKTPPATLNRRQLVYAADDCVYPWYILQDQGKEIRERGLLHVLKIEFGVLPILIEAQMYGMRIDADRWKELWQLAVERQDKAEKVLDSMFQVAQGDLFGGKLDSVRPMFYGSHKKPEPLNWSGAMHVKWAIETYCAAIQWPVQLLSTQSQLDKAKEIEGRDWAERKGIRDAKGADIPDFVLDESKYCVLLKVDQPTLKLRKIRKQLPADFIDALLAYQHEKALVATFGNSFLRHVQEDGRLHFTFNQLIAATGRLSSEPSSMNLPKTEEYRRCIIPAPGYRFVVMDYSQIEPRISAFVSGDEVYNRTFEEDTDLYCTVAEAMLGEYPDVEAADKDARVAAEKNRSAIKAVVLGMAYKMGAGKLRDSLTLVLKENVVFKYASDLHRTFRERCFGLVKFQDECAKLADPNGTRKIWDRYVGDFVTWIESSCGRKRYFRKTEEDVSTAACNHPIQGLSATQLKAALCDIQAYIDAEALDAHPINFIHDEVVYEVREDIAESFAAHARELMEAAAKRYIPTVKVKAEYPKGHHNGTVMFWTKNADKELEI